MDNNIYLISPRRFRIINEYIENGILIRSIQWLESEEQWMKRCAVIKNIRERREGAENCTTSI